MLHDDNHVLIFIAIYCAEARQYVMLNYENDCKIHKMIFSRLQSLSVWQKDR